MKQQKNYQINLRFDYLYALVYTHNMTKEKAVVIRISRNARLRIKKEAVNNNLSIIDYVEDLSRQKLDKKIRNVITV